MDENSCYYLDTVLIIMDRLVRRSLHPHFTLCGVWRTMLSTDNNLKESQRLGFFLIISPTSVNMYFFFFFINLVLCKPTTKLIYFPDYENLWVALLNTLKISTWISV